MFEPHLDPSQLIAPRDAKPETDTGRADGSAPDLTGCDPMAFATAKPTDDQPLPTRRVGVRALAGALAMLALVGGTLVAIRATGNGANPASAALVVETDAPVEVVEASRSNGLNYLIVRSFDNRAAAKIWQNRLASRGIDCTVEPGLEDWCSPDWFCLVTTDGYTRLDDPTLADRVTELRDLGFDPAPYRWR